MEKLSFTERAEMARNMTGEQRRNIAAELESARFNRPHPSGPVDRDLRFFKVLKRTRFSETVYNVAAETVEGAIALVKAATPFYKRPFTQYFGADDLDPVELSDSGYLQKIGRMHFVENIDRIIRG